jgi:hypothetical protein
VAGRRNQKRKREIEYVIDLWRSEHPEAAGEPIAPEVVADWADQKKVVRRQQVSAAEVLRREIVGYLGQSTQIDPQGREVRGFAVNFVKVTTAKGNTRRRSRWLPLFDAPKEFAKGFFQWQRTGALHDLISMETNRESWNDNNRFGETIEQGSLDFTNDVAEMKMPTTYPADAPVGVDDDEDD